MADIQITPNNVLKKVDELEAALAKIKVKIEELEKTELDKNARWEGKASDAFHALFVQNKEKLERYYVEIQKYIQVLRDVANKYIKAENQNIDLINAGRHG